MTDKPIQLQLFDPDDPKSYIRKKKKKTAVDYEKLYELFLRGPVRFCEIEAASGVSHNSVAQVITTLSLKYPIYEVRRGLYKLYGADDYGDGINHEALKEYAEED